MISLFAGCFKWKMMGCFTSGTKDKQSKERLTLLDDSYGNNDTIPDLSKISDQNSGNNTLKNAKKNTIEQVIHRGNISQRRNPSKHLSYPPSYQYWIETNRNGKIFLSLQHFCGESTNCFNMRVIANANNSNMQVLSEDNDSETKEIEHGQLSGSYDIYDDDNSPIYYEAPRRASDCAAGQNVDDLLDCYKINGCIINSISSTANSNTNIEYMNFMPSPKSKRELDYAVISNLSGSPPDCHSSKSNSISLFCKEPRPLTKDFDETDYTSIDVKRTSAIRSASFQQRH